MAIPAENREKFGTTKDTLAAFGFTGRKYRLVRAMGSGQNGRGGGRGRSALPHTFKI